MSEITQAFVLGAGLGTRLRPLTDDLPKPLVPVFQKPLITFAFDHLIDIGIANFFANTHHRPERFVEAFPAAIYRDRRIQFVHEPELLETAGGIANIAGALPDEPLLVYNADILTDLPIARLIDRHFHSGNIVTLALRSGQEPKHIAFDAGSGRILDIQNALGSGLPHELLFTGIYIIERRFIDRLERGVKRSVVPYFLELIRAGEKIGGVVIDEGNWWDVGNRASYLQLHRDLLRLKFPAYRVGDPNWKTTVHESATVDASAELRGCSVVGRNCEVGAGAILDDTILWAGAQIASKSHLLGCIVRTHRRVEGIHQGIDI